MPKLMGLSSAPPLPKSPSEWRKDKPYGKRVIDIRENMINKNPIIESILGWSNY